MFLEVDSVFPRPLQFIKLCSFLSLAYMACFRLTEFHLINCNVYCLWSKNTYHWHEGIRHTVMLICCPCWSFIPAAVMALDLLVLGKLKKCFLFPIELYRWIKTGVIRVSAVHNLNLFLYFCLRFSCFIQVAPP